MRTSRPGTDTPRDEATSARAPAPNDAPGAVIVPFPSPMEPVRRVKSTLLLASIAALKEAGHFESYYRRLDPEFDDEVLRSLAGAWVSAAAARAHYAACDTLVLTAAEQLSLGQRTDDGLKPHLTRLAGLVSRGAGVTPWSLFAHFNRFWARTFDGGGVSVVKLGPKEAEVVYARCALLGSSYFRSALRGVAVGLLGAVTQRSFMSEVTAGTRVDEARYRFSWV